MVCEIRSYAASVLLGEDLEAKLVPPDPALTDLEPGDGTVEPRPGRAHGIAIENDTGRKRKVPSLEGFRDKNQRVRILNALANHELQAIELFAYALLKWPATPTPFRRGLLRILGEEQRHFRLYQDAMHRLGARFGDWPLSGYFWTRARLLETPLEFICAMCLTFENANLDHALDLEAAALAAGDREIADALRIVHDDEVGHVRFGLHWLGMWKQPQQTLHDAWVSNLKFPLRPELARGDVFREASRRAAGFDDDFIALLAAAERPRALYHFVKSPSDRSEGPAND